MALTDTGVGGTILMAGSPVKLLLAGAVKQGDAVGYSSGWKRALATTGTAIQAKYVAGEDGAIGDTITCYADCIVGGRFSGGTPGAPVYAEEGTSNGLWTEAAPATTGDCNKICGTVLTATTVHFFPTCRPETVA